MKHTFSEQVNTLIDYHAELIIWLLWSVTGSMQCSCVVRRTADRKYCLKFKRSCTCREVELPSSHS